MKYIFVLLFSSFSVAATPLQETLQSTEKFLSSQQIDGTYWQGPYTLDVSNEALVLGLGYKLGLLTPKLKDELIATIFLRQHESGNGWAAYPGGEVNFDITLITLKVLELVGVERNDSRVGKAWSFLYAQDKTIGVYTLLHLVPMGLLSREWIPEVPIKMLGASNLYPLNFQNLGILQTFTVPFVTWNYFYAKTHGEFVRDPFSDIGAASISLKNFLQASVTGHDEHWAKEGIGRILEKQNPEGGWYALNFAFISMLALWEAQNAGYGDFTETLKRSWEKILSWRSKSFEGFNVQQSTLSDIWDTASITYTLQTLGQNMDRQIQWLESKTVLFPKEKSRAWSFNSHDKSLPDLDDTAVVVQTLATSQHKEDLQTQVAIREGVKWILDRQNKDGGFPAWTRGVPKSLFKIARKIIKNLPEIEDISQMDITGRVVHMLSIVKKSGVQVDPRVEASLAQACRFLKNGGEGVKGVPFRISHGHWFSNYFYSASMQLIGLIHGNCSGSLPPTVAHWLVLQQNSDGGWGESNLSYARREPVKMYSTLSQTALVLTGLIEYFKFTGDGQIGASISRGIDFLIRKSNRGQDWFEKDFAAVVVKNHLYNRYELVPAYASLYVLGQWQGILTKR